MKAAAHGSCPTRLAASSGPAAISDKIIQNISSAPTDRPSNNRALPETGWTGSTTSRINESRDNLDTQRVNAATT
jgi:hypothetical protein